MRITVEEVKAWLQKFHQVEAMVNEVGGFRLSDAVNNQYTWTNGWGITVVAKGVPNGTGDITVNVTFEPLTMWTSEQQAQLPDMLRRLLAISPAR